jgi:hypothetical protein
VRTGMDPVQKMTNLNLRYLLGRMDDFRNCSICRTTSAEETERGEAATARCTRPRTPANSFTVRGCTRHRFSVGSTLLIR